MTHVMDRFFLSCQEFCFCCLARSSVFCCFVRSFGSVLPGDRFSLSCQEQCDVREYARVCRGKIELWDPKMLIKAGKSSKNRAFWAQGAKIVLWDPKIGDFRVPQNKNPAVDPWLAGEAEKMDEILHKSASQGTHKAISTEQGWQDCKPAKP